jgi:hypothetical protein
VRRALERAEPVTRELLGERPHVLGERRRAAGDVGEDQPV